MYNSVISLFDRRTMVQTWYQGQNVATLSGTFVTFILYDMVRLNK